ncbi:MAG: glycoside hydrolase family 38 C-terminal domain-containing protein [Pseudobacter sp.]|uniref:glycoside hydrolase family 38 N-terminal domain-containing protein n=1 Tax=Pseudobacter sp. TaxID=2045420 RepID=UPI003F802B03
MKRLLLLFISGNLVAGSYGQQEVPFLGQITWQNGYAQELSGENISYFSALPNYANISLLTRSTDGKKTIEWKTADVPAGYSEPYVYFAWVASHSTGTNRGMESRFDLYVNDEKLLTFTALPDNKQMTWKFDGPDSSALVFQHKKSDAVQDAHGIAYLRLPIKMVTPGQPVKLKVTGHAQGNNNWYMTFKFPYKEMAQVEVQPFILKDGRASISLVALHFGKNANLNVKLNNKENLSFPVQDGMNRFDIPVSNPQKRDSVLVSVALENELLVERFVQIEPVKPRVLHFIHHSHTDIGYSHLQPEVARIHNKNIDDALAMIEATKDLPPDARFKWNVESIWAVDNYLREASPAQQKKFVKAVKDGNICLSALYANLLTGLSEPEELFNYIFYAKELSEKYGFTFRSAMISDVPGSSWSIVTALALSGIKYYSSGPNYIGAHHPYLGDRVGHFVRTWGDKPVWWKSPSGKEKILFWTGGRGYSSWHGTAPGAVFDNGPGKIAAYLRDLDKSGYPYDMVQWRYNVVADNGPVDTAISRFVDEWNQRYSSPRIVLNTTDRLFEEFEKKYGSVIPEVKGDITPYWEDGAYSTADEEGKNRTASLQLQQLTTLYAMLNPALYDRKLFDSAWKSIILFHEHTWGAHNSISEPDISFVTEQWKIKKQFGKEAEQMVGTLKQSLLQPLMDEASSRIAVFNTLSFNRSGLVTIINGAGFHGIKDPVGKVLPLQELSDGRKIFMANDIPAFGTMIYTLTKEKPGTGKNPFSITDSSVSNGKISLVWDKNNGSVISFRRNDPFNYAGSFNGQGMNSYWYVPGMDPAAALTNKGCTVKAIERGPVMTVIHFESEAPGANKLEKNLRLYAGSNIVEIENIVDKKPVREKEGLHFGFPFHRSFSDIRLDAGYGIMKYSEDYLQGSNMDYLYGRRWLDASAAKKGIQWMLLETPLVEADSMIDERRILQGSHKVWKSSRPESTNWFSYAMNNYWHTNYKADQEGLATFRYALRAHDGFDGAASEKAAAGFTQPLLAVPVKKEFRLAGSLFTLTNEQVVVTSVKPVGKNKFLIRVYNPSDKAASFSFKWNRIKPEKILAVRTAVTLPPTQTILIAGMEVMELEVTITH